MYDKILVPTDGSEGSEVALQDALEIAEKFDAEVHLLYVIDVRVDSTQDMMNTLIGQFEEIGEDATSSMAEEVEERELEAVTEIKRGIPHKEINQYIEDNDIDMVAMGTHGRSGLDRMLLGSVTEKVIRTSGVPVMTVTRDDS